MSSWNSLVPSRWAYLCTCLFSTVRAFDGMFDDGIVAEEAIDVRQEIQGQTYSDEVDQWIDEHSAMSALAATLTNSEKERNLPICEDYSSVLDCLWARVISTRLHEMGTSPQNEKFLFQISWHQRQQGQRRQDNVRYKCIDNRRESRCDSVMNQGG